ncbi:unnamed protein product [Spirodela intermedia]|uniref:Uncharacterized protein n=1 Tax=Spirodela intermedia TaxID=51605 RepID=A0A7I8IYR7_SPIIN|nr:unnamed protein product [Spirodela intermedia]CAA6662283.1 unnamed protein product [Spirodela intermedia]
MGEEECLPLIAGGGLSPTSNAWEILCRVAKLLGRAWKLLFPLLFIYLITSTLLLFGNYITIMPLIVDMVKKLFAMKTEDPSSSEFLALLRGIIEDIRELAAAEVGMMLPFPALVVPLDRVINALAMAAKKEKMTFKDLLYKITRTWKGLFSTLLYSNFLSFGYIFFWLLLRFAFLFHFGHYLPPFASSAITIVPGLALLLYLQMVWTQGVVVSVTEEGRYGLTALGRAAELIQGRIRLWLGVNCLKFLIFAGWYLIMILLRKVTNPLITLAVSFYPMLLVSVFCLAVDVAFYNECRKAAEGNP